MPQVRKPVLPAESFFDLHWPTKGLDVSEAYSEQRQGTTPVGTNVRTFEPTTNRGRGGSRCGLSKYLSTQPSGASGLIQELAVLVGVGYTDPGGSPQSSQNSRVIDLVAVQGGNAYVASAGGTAWVAAINASSGTPPLNTTGVVRSAANNMKLWFADGTNYRYYDPSVNRVLDWVATSGSLPANSGNTPRLIATWRGRTVLSGISTDPQNWFMSAVGDPTNYNYFPTTTVSGGTVPTPTPTQAVAGNNSPLGLIGDIVTALVSYTDDVLFAGGDHTIWQFQGDPMAGGQIALVSDAIGMAWGAPWCKGPDGTLFFLSNRTGIYALKPGQAATGMSPPQRISQPVENLLNLVNTGTNIVRLAWDDRWQGLHVFVSKTASAQATTHFFWEERTGAWWQDVFANANHNPLCLCVFDGNTAEDRVVLLGSWDGYVRSLDPLAVDDDGTNIASSVALGPMLTRNLDALLLKDLQCVLGESSGAVTYNVLWGNTPESALSATPMTGTWNASRNLSTPVRRSGHALWVKITATTSWQFEVVRARLQGQGKVQRRGR